MALINNRDLDNLCNSILTKTIDLYPRTYTCFQMLYIFGFRWIEIFELSRWTKNLDGTFTCDTAKNSKNRIISARDIPELYKTMAASDDENVMEFGYMSMIRYFTRFSWFPKMYLGDKQISLHAFRHNKARLLKERGWKDKDISKYFGEVDQKNMDRYIYSKIYDGK